MKIYFDNSATTKVRQEVIDAMLPHLCDNFGNPSSIHAVGRAAHQMISKARKEVAALLNASPAEVYFSSGGTVSNNVAILGRARFVRANNLGNHVITTQIEHPSVMGPCRYLEQEGFKVTYLPVDKQGFVEIDRFKKALSEDTCIVSIMWANNEIGTVEPIAELGAIIKEASDKFGKQIFFHSDAVQAAAKVPLDVERAQVHALSLSGHKFHAPKGAGALYLRKGFNVMPIIFGGGQEKGLLPGTEGLANIVGLGKAAELARVELDSNIARLKEMQRFLMDELSKFGRVQMTGPTDLERRLPGHISLAIENAEGEAIVMQLDLKGVCTSSASACHTGVIEPSHVLTALNLPCSLTKGSLRISLGRFNTMDECREALKALHAVLPNNTKEKKETAAIR